MVKAGVTAAKEQDFQSRGSWSGLCSGDGGMKKMKEVQEGLKCWQVEVWEKQEEELEV